MTEIFDVQDHFEDIYPLMDIIYEEWGDVFRKTKQQKIEKYKNAIENNFPYPKYFVVKERDEVIGGFAFSDHELEDEKYQALSPWLMYVVIKKDCRGKGYGREILTHIDNVAQKSFSQLYLFTKHTGYYEKIGFEFVEEIIRFGEKTRIYIKKYEK